MRTRWSWRPPFPFWRSRKTDAGVALVFVLWLIVLLSAVAMGMAFRGHLRMQVTAATGDSTKAYYLARSGVEAAMADLEENADTAGWDQQARDDASDLYCNVELGEGTYTLYAGTDDTGNPQYGFIDECSKLNISTADSTVLEKLPDLGPEWAAAIVQRRERQAFRDLKDLLAIEGIDPVALYGEDANENGLLDANEDDGEETWPPDNGDGELDGGLADRLTVWSASKDVTSDGETRVKINEADLEAIKSGIKDIDEQQAQSIVSHRDKSKFATVLDLLDVELVEMKEQPPPDPNQPQGGQPPPEGQQPQDEQNKGKESGQQNSGDADKPNDKDASKESGKDGGQDPQQGQESGQNQGQQGLVAVGTGKKAFDESSVRKIADLFTTQGEEVQHGLVNINTASAEVLACLPGLTESLAQAIVTKREATHGGFTKVIDLLDVNGMSVDILKQMYGLVTARSDAYRVRSYGVLRSGAVYASVSAVLDRSEGSVHIRYWQEHE